MMIKNILHVIKLHFCAKRIAKKDKMPYLDRHRYIRKFLYIYHRDMKVKQNVFGIENLNGLEGCVFMGNHQSQEDGPALLKALGDNDYAAACLINDERTHYFFFSNLCDMLKFKRIKFDDLRSQAIELSTSQKKLSNVPITISMAKNKIVTFILGLTQKQKYIESLILQLMYYYSPNDLKLIILTTKENEENWEYLKYTPYMWSEKKDKISNA